MSLKKSLKEEKIVINMGLGLDGNDSKILKSCENDLALLTGQKPVLTKFKKSLSLFLILLLIETTHSGTMNVVRIINNIDIPSTPTL